MLLEKDTPETILLIIINSISKNIFTDYIISNFK